MTWQELRDRRRVHRHRDQRRGHGALSSSDHLTISHNTVTLSGHAESGQNAAGIDVDEDSGLQFYPGGDNNVGADNAVYAAYNGIACAARRGPQRGEHRHRTARPPPTIAYVGRIAAGAAAGTSTTLTLPVGRTVAANDTLVVSLLSRCLSAPRRPAR